MDRRNRLIIIICAIAVFLTFIIFFQMTKTRTEVDWYALIFILIAELGTLGGLIAVNAEAKRSFSLMLKAGSYTVLGLYTVAAIVLSILFTTVPTLRENVSLFKSIQAILIALAAIIILILASASRATAKKNKASEHSSSIMHELMLRVSALRDSTQNPSYSAQLNKIFDAIKYSDLSSSSDKDDVISSRIAELENLLTGNMEENKEKTMRTFDQILLLLKQRSAEIKELKGGRI